MSNLTTLKRHDLKIDDICMFAKKYKEYPDWILGSGTVEQCIGLSLGAQVSDGFSYDGLLNSSQDLALEPLLGFSLPVLCDVPGLKWRCKLAELEPLDLYVFVLSMSGQLLLSQTNLQLTHSNIFKCPYFPILDVARLLPLALCDQVLWRMEPLLPPAYSQGQSHSGIW